MRNTKYGRIEIMSLNEITRFDVLVEVDGNWSYYQKADGTARIVAVNV